MLVIILFREGCYLLTSLILLARRSGGSNCNRADDLTILMREIFPQLMEEVALRAVKRPATRSERKQKGAGVHQKKEFNI